MMTLGRNMPWALSAIVCACSANEASMPSDPMATAGAGATPTDTGGMGGAPVVAPTGDPGGGSSVMFDEPLEETDRCGADALDVLFVLDRSGSMNCNLPPLTSSSACEEKPERVDPTEPSKWEVVKDGFSAVFDRLAPEDAAVDVRAGVSFFSVDDVCGARSTPDIPVSSVTPAHISQLKTSLDITPAGGTPIVGATVLAYKHLYQPETFTGAAHVILLTDGSDSCGESYKTTVGPGDHVADLIEVEAPKALSVGIKTWVIGAPGSESARHMLSRLAVAGGTAPEGCDPGDGSDPSVGNCHYDMTTGDFSQALTDTLLAIADVVTCQIR